MKTSIIAIVLTFLLSLTSACDATKTLTEGFSQAKTVSADLKEKAGIEPFVGFNWHNGSLTSVTVTFSEFPKGKSFVEIAELTRQSIKKRFAQEPQQIVISFAIKP